jgi:hypothetical protein
MTNTRFTRLEDGCVQDNQLNFIWYPTLPKKLTWEEAKKECEKLGYRLPTLHELASLIDVTKCEKDININIFPDTKTDDWYWTNDICLWHINRVRVVYFYYGTVGHSNKNYGGYVRPVRPIKRRKYESN